MPSNWTRRSLLLCGTDSRSEMRAAVETDADTVVFDLEDAVADGKKEAARRNLVRVVDEVDFGDKEVCARINDLRTDHWHDDVETAAEAGVDTIRLSKVREPWEVETATRTAARLSADPPEVVLSLEDPEGVLNGTAIARRCAELPRVTGIAFGLEDYTTAVGAPTPTMEIREFLLHRVAAYASVGNVDPLSGSYTDVTDPAGLETWAKQARAAGHIGQPAIHPSQIDVINEVFTPTRAEYERAKRIVNEYDARPDAGVIRLDGELVERPMVERHRRTVTRYEAVHG